MSEKLTCHACSAKSLTKFLSLGKMPVSNAYPTQKEIDQGNEYLYDLEVGFCDSCKMVQLTNFVPYDKYIVPDQSGKTNYAFFSSTSKAMQAHFADFAKQLQTEYLKPGQNVAEIGGNDGIMLQSFDKDYHVLNIEPSSNVAAVSREKGIETIEEFFNEDLAKKLVKQKGRFGAIASSNVVLNIHDINSVVKGVEHMLDKGGVFAMQDPYLGRILQDKAFDQIYDEHVWYFSVSSLSNLFERHGMEVFDAELHEVHGGSMRVFASRKGEREKTSRLQRILEQETELQMDTILPYQQFAADVEGIKNELRTLLDGLKSDGKRIVGYAAASKGTIILNYANIGRNYLDYIVDSTPFKQGRFIPGVHIPIVSPETFRANYPDYALLGARNHEKEIMGKEGDFIRNGGKFIVSIPTPKIIK